MAPARISERGSFQRPSSGLSVVATFECATVKGCSIHRSASPTFPPPSVSESVHSTGATTTSRVQQKRPRPPLLDNNPPNRPVRRDIYIETTQTHQNHEVVPPAALAGRRCSSAPLLHRRHQPQVFLRGIAQGHTGGWPLHGRGMGRPEAFVAEARWHQHLHLCRCMFSYLFKLPKLPLTPIHPTYSNHPPPTKTSNTKPIIACSHNRLHTLPSRNSSTTTTVSSPSAAAQAASSHSPPPRRATTASASRPRRPQAGRAGCRSTTRMAGSS